MHRFYVAPENWDPLGLALRGSEAHHARNVLRMQAGDKLVLFNGEGRELTAEITNVADHEIRLRKLHESEMAPLRCRIVLGRQSQKGKTWTSLCRRPSRLVQPKLHRSFPTAPLCSSIRKAASQKQTKWQQIAIEAAKQCGQNWLPRVHAPKKLAEFFSTSDQPFDLRLIGSLQPDAQQLKKFWKPIRASTVIVLEAY
jgi:RNA methyltransferase, RsmE family